MISSLTDRHQSKEIHSLDGDHCSTDRVERGGLRPVPTAPQPPPPALHLVAPEGQLQVHTAPYRGSFSSVLSEAMRAAGQAATVRSCMNLKLTFWSHQM